MIEKIFLDKDDLAELISEHYNVKKEAVDIHCFQTLEGWGMYENYVPDVEVIITKKGEENETAEAGI